MTDLEIVTQPIFRKQMLYRARKKIKDNIKCVDAEDIVQNAYLMYLLYKDRLNNENPERLFSWLVNIEVSRIYKKYTRSFIDLTTFFNLYPIFDEDICYYDYFILKNLHDNRNKNKTYRNTEFKAVNKIKDDYLQIKNADILITFNNIVQKAKEKGFIKIHARIRLIKENKKERISKKPNKIVKQLYEYYKITQG